MCAKHERRDRRPDRSADVREIVDRRLDVQLDSLDEPAVDDGARTRRRIAVAARAPDRRESARSRRAGAASPTGRCAAASRRRGDRAARASARGARRACVPAIAWISSTITARTPLNIPRPRTVVSMMCSDSGVVMRMCGDLRSIRARADCRRVAGAHGDADLRERLARRLEALAQLGERPLEVALDVVVQRLERRDVEDLHRVRQRRRAAPSTMSWFSSQRNAVSVLPVPVGARMSVCAPLAIAGQPSRCGALGAPSVSRTSSNEERNGLDDRIAEAA